jgi:hypothetical protein
MTDDRMLYRAIIGSLSKFLNRGSKNDAIRRTEIMFSKFHSSLKRSLISEIIVYLKWVVL